ncbi:MAG: IucA/IucC family protein, partial [Mycobacteriaceae bacterium]
MSARLWLECGTRLVEKTLAELSFEGLVEPVADGTGWSLTLPACTYTFTGRRSWFGSWVLDPGSVRRTVLGVLGDATAEPVHDVAKLLCDLAPEVGIAPDTLAGYIGETTATLAADVRLASTGLGVEDLADLVLGPLGGIHTDGHLAGHPWLVANKGRVGFSAEDLVRYAPEARTPLRLPWVAVHRGLAEFRAVPALSEDAVRLHQLGAETVAKFGAVLRERGCDPATYV